MNRGNVVVGAALTVLGLCALLDDLGVVDLRLAALGPLLLVTVGLALVATAVLHKGPPRDPLSHRPQP